MDNNKVLIDEVLAQKGWTALDYTRTYAIAKKVFDTAVGHTQALIWMSEGGTLTAEYESKGQNVLETTFFHSSEMKSDIDIINGAKDFADEIEKNVDDSFARKLLLKRKIRA